MTAYGESFVEEGIPAAELGDGWAITFERFQVELGSVTMAGIVVAPPAAIDLAVPSAGQGHELGVARVAAGQYTDAAFTIERVVVEGAATRDAVTKTFHWTFDAPTVYSDCESVTDVRDGDRAVFQITCMPITCSTIASSRPNEPVIPSDRRCRRRPRWRNHPGRTRDDGHRCLRSRERRRYRRPLVLAAGADPNLGARRR